MEIVSRNYAKHCADFRPSSAGQPVEARSVRRGGPNEPRLRSHRTLRNGPPRADPHIAGARVEKVKLAHGGGEVIRLPAFRPALPPPAERSEPTESGVRQKGPVGSQHAAKSFLELEFHAWHDCPRRKIQRPCSSSAGRGCRMSCGHGWAHFCQNFGHIEAPVAALFLSCPLGVCANVRTNAPCRSHTRPGRGGSLPRHASGPKRVAGDLHVWGRT